VVDDHPDVREFLRMVLTDAGYPTVTAKSGTEALDLLQSGLRPSVVVVDLMMPGMDGWQLIPAIRALELPVAVVSMTAGERLLEAPVSAAYLQKPFSEADLIRVVGKFAGPPRRAVATT
jgi:CheY-like chemotaxis protein